MNSRLLTALAALSLLSSCGNERVEGLDSELAAMRGQVQQLQAQLAEQSGRQQRSEAQMVEWLDATSRQLDRFLDRIGAPPLDPAAPPDPAPVAAAPDASEATDPPQVEAAAEVPAPELTPPVAGGPTVFFSTLALLAACAGIGFAAFRVLRSDDQAAREPAAPVTEDGHTKLLASLTEWEQAAHSAPAAAATVAAESQASETVPQGEESVPIAAVHPDTTELEIAAHHGGPAVLDPESAGRVDGTEAAEAAPQGDSAATLSAPELPAAEPLAAVPLAAEPVAVPDPVVEPAAAPLPEVPSVPQAAEPVEEVVRTEPSRRSQVVEHDVPGRIAADGPFAPRGGEPIRLPGPPRARFRAMTPSPEDAAVALAAILQIDSRVMRRPAPTVSTTPTTVVAEYSLVPALPPGERGDLEARLWQAVGDARKRGSHPQPSV